MLNLIPLAFAQAQAETEKVSGIAKVAEYLIRQFPLWVAAVIVFMCSIFLAKVAKRWVENKIAEKGIEEEHKGVQILGGRMANAAVLVIGITAALKIAGIDITSIIAAAAFAIGFALKDLIMNFLAGIMILMSRHFTIGDFIKVNDIVGEIKEIQTRATIIRSLEGTKVVVPNAELFTNVVTSFTSNPFRRIEIMVGVDYGTDLKLAVDKCYEALKKTQKILLEPAPVVILAEFAESSINLKVRGWVESRGGWLRVKSNLIIAIKETFDEAGITIPWPIRTVYYGKDLKADQEKALEQGIMKKQEQTIALESQTKSETSVEQITQPQSQLQSQSQEIQSQTEIG